MVAMDRSERERTMQARFRDRYAVAYSPVMLEIEGSVLGSDYGASSWTTRQEADLFAGLLLLKRGDLLLDVGSGAGWPGLYLARTTGCRVVLTDLPFEGLRSALLRASQEGLEGAAWPMVAKGEALPFRDESFDAVTHADVLC